MLAVAVALVLLVACTNVAHLLLARSATRQRELAIRAALGAGRGRLLRQLLSESLLLSTLGTALGVVAGWAGLRVIVALRPESLTELHAAHLDGTTVTLAVGIAVVSGLAFGAIGVLQAARQTTHEALKGGAVKSASLRRQRRLRGGLVVSEMALSATMLVAATLLVRSVIHLQRADLGFEPRGLYVVSLPLRTAGSSANAADASLMRDFMARVRPIPNVRAVAAASVEPGARRFSIGRLEVDGEPPPSPETTSFVDVNAVQAGYFATMEMSFDHGSTFTDSTAQGRQVIVNAGFARKHWPQAYALGKRIRIARTGSEPWYTIVGVVRDAQTSGPLAESSAPMLYTPLFAAMNDSTRPLQRVAVLVRTDGSAGTLASIADIIKQLRLKNAPPPVRVTDTISRSIATPRFVMLLLTVFTVLALVLASIGLYGVMAYTVTQRTREIGIRLALGASGARIARAILAWGAGLSTAGAAIGVVAAIWGTKLIESELYGVTRSDPVSLAIGVAILVAATMAACIVPARRAISVDPVRVIRAE
jgi:predicted permease